jgi:hypothetical protein
VYIYILSVDLALSIHNKQQQFHSSFCQTKCNVEKLDDIQDVFIHFQLLRFCQGTRLQYLNSYIMFSNRCVLQQQHLDCKITDALLKKGTKPNPKRKTEDLTRVPPTIVSSREEDDVLRE